MACSILCISKQQEMSLSTRRKVAELTDNSCVNFVHGALFVVVCRKGLIGHINRQLVYQLIVFAGFLPGTSKSSCAAL